MSTTLAIEVFGRLRHDLKANRFKPGERLDFSRIKEMYEVGVAPLREALSRLESMITMGGFTLPSRTIREMICASVDVVIQAARLRDGSRRITHITEVMGLEGDVIITQDLFLFDLLGEDANGKLVGRHHSTGIGRPRFWDRARYYGEDKNLAAALDAAEKANAP